MSEVVADNHDTTLATNNFALIANLLHAWLYLHADLLLLILLELLVPINNSTAREVIRTQLHDYTISWQDADVVLTHLPANVREDSVSVC